RRMRRWQRSRKRARWTWISVPACASPPPGPFSRHARSSILCFTTAARCRCSRILRSNVGCATLTRVRNRARGGYCTTRRWGRSCLAWCRKIFSERVLVDRGGGGGGGHKFPHRGHGVRTEFHGEGRILALRAVALALKRPARSAFILR